MQWFRHYAASLKVAASRPDKVMTSFNFPNSSSRIRALWFTRPLIEMSTRSRTIMFLGSSAQPVRRVDNLTVNCEPAV
jgi:hypothetical protein